MIIFVYYDRYTDTLLILLSPSNLFVKCRFNGLENAKKSDGNTLCSTQPLFQVSSRQQEGINAAVMPKPITF